MSTTVTAAAAAAVAGPVTGGTIGSHHTVELQSQVLAFTILRKRV